MLTRRRRSQAGQSAIEILIGLGLAAILGLMITQLLRVSRYEVDQRVRSIQRSTLRTEMDRVMGQLRNSRPLGECISQPGANFSSCRRVGERPFTLADEADIAKRSDATQVCFYAQDDSVVDPFAVPDLVCLKIVGTNMVVETTEGTGTYTNPVWPGTARSRLVGRVDPTATSFAYFVQQADGTPGEIASFPLSTVDKRRVVLIEARVSVRDATLVNKSVSTKITFQAAPRGSRLQREQNFQEL